MKQEAAWSAVHVIYQTGASYLRIDMSRLLHRLTSVPPLPHSFFTLPSPHPPRYLLLPHLLPLLLFLSPPHNSLLPLPSFPLLPAPLLPLPLLLSCFQSKSSLCHRRLPLHHLFLKPPPLCLFHQTPPPITPLHIPPRTTLPLTLLLLLQALPLLLPSKSPAQTQNHLPPILSHPLLPSPPRPLLHPYPVQSLGLPRSR